MVTELVPDRGDQQVADGVVLERTVAGESVLQDARPGAAPFVVAAQRGESHTEVAGWQHAELFAQSSGGPPVVGDRDDSGELSGEMAQRREAGCQPMATTQRNDSWSVAHSRPRSLCTTSTCTPWARSRSPSASAMATLRWRPPVQPSAIVRKCWSSRR